MTGKCYIFLDYDGVVACARKWWKMPAHKGFEPKAMANLNSLVQQLEEGGKEVSVVPITSRLRWQPVNLIKSSLRDAGFTGTIEDGLEIGSKNYMPKQVWITRGEALKQWCDTHLTEQDSYIILDNNHPKSLPDDMMPRWIKVDSDEKLRKRDVKKALEILGVASPEPTSPQEVAADEGKGKKRWREAEEQRKKEGDTAVCR